MASRANHLVLLRGALLSSAALVCSVSAMVWAAEGPSAAAVVAADIPVASNVRLAGDARQTRFILDLDRKIDVRASTLSDPYRVVLDLPQVTFNLPAGTGTAGYSGDGGTATASQLAGPVAARLV